MCRFNCGLVRLPRISFLAPPSDAWGTWPDLRSPNPRSIPRQQRVSAHTAAPVPPETQSPVFSQPLLSIDCFQTSARDPGAVLQKATHLSILVFTTSIFSLLLPSSEAAFTDPVCCSLSPAGQH